MRRFPNCLTCSKWVGEPDQLEGCCVPLEYEPVSFQSSHLANLLSKLQSPGGRIQVTNVVRRDENWNWLWALNWLVSEVPQEIMKCNYCISWCNSSTWIAVIFHDAHGVPEVHGVQCCTRSTLIPNVPEMPGILRLPGVLPLLVLLPQAAPLPYPCQHLVFAQDSFNSCDRNQDLSFSHLVHWAFWAHP